MNYDKLFINANIFTSDYQDINYTAMALCGDTIVWLGKSEDLNLRNSDLVNVIDLEGKRVLPGFIDSHMHAIMYANCCKQIAVLPPEINSIEDLILRIKDVKKSLKPGEWIQGWGYDEGKLFEGRPPNRWDLDKGIDDIPVYILRSCVHIASVNSKALEIAGIDKNTPNPPGGIIGRDSSGEPNGILYENARYLVYDHIPKLSSDDVAENIIDLGEILSSQGVTTCTELGEFMEIDLKDIFKKAVKKGYKQNTCCYYIWDYIKNDKYFKLTETDRNQNEQIRFLGIKLICDGSVSGKTAWCDIPYINCSEYGLPTCSENDIISAIKYAEKNNLQISVHAMGSKAIERVVKNMSSFTPWTKDIPTFRIEHVAMPFAKDIETAAKNKIFFITQPIFLYCEIESYINNLGYERTKECYPMSKFLKCGVNFALSTDSPATSWATPTNPFVTIKAACTRNAWDGTDCGHDNRISIKDAIVSYTREGAHVLGYSDRGMLKEGYKADFIVLDKDIFEVCLDEIDKIKVQETYINGKKVYSINQ